MLISKSIQDMTPVQLVYESFRHLTKEEKIEAFSKIHSDYLRAKINFNSFDDFIESIAGYDEENAVPVVCPIDSTHKVVRDGYTTNGKQRYFCKVCNKSFSVGHNSLIYRTNQDITIWYRFVSGLLKQESIESLRDACSIVNQTAQNWQLRVFEAIRCINDKIKLSGTVYADDTRIGYSLKGNHRKTFIMPRKARKRGGQNTIKNHNKNKMCVLCGVDDFNHSFSKIIGFGNPSKKRILKGFDNKLDTVKVLVTDGARCFSDSVKHYQIREWHRKTTRRKGKKRVPNTDGKYNIQKINAYHDDLKRFFRCYKGISSRCLPGYLLLFDFLKNFKNESHEEKCIMILSALSQKSEVSTIAELEKRYVIPLSNGNEKEVWELKIPKRDRQIYIDWVNRVPIKEIINKYHINKRYIYSVRDRVKKYNVHDKILNPQPVKKSKLRPISDKAWKIYTTYKLSDKNIKEVAQIYNVSPQYVGKLIKTIDARPEAIPDSKKPKKKSKKKTAEQKHNDLLKRNEEICALYRFLYTEGSVLQDTIRQISVMLDLSNRTVRTVLYEYRQKENSIDSRYGWSDERRSMSKHEYDEILRVRNQKIYDEYTQIVIVEGIRPKTKVKKLLSEKYSVSLSHFDLILRQQRQQIMQQHHQLNSEPEQENVLP